MQMKKTGIALVATLATALAATPALAQPRGGHGGGHFSGGAAHFGAGGGGRIGGAGFNGGAARSFAASPTVRTNGAQFAASRSGNWSGHHWNGGGRSWHRGGRGWGGFGAGLAAGALIGGAYGYGYGYPSYYGDDYAYYGDDDGYYGDAYAAAPEYSGGDSASCAMRYRSYDPASGTYLGYDGIRHPCP